MLVLGLSNALGTTLYWVGTRAPALGTWRPFQAHADGQWSFPADIQLCLVQGAICLPVVPALEAQRSAGAQRSGPGRCLPVCGWIAELSAVLPVDSRGSCLNADGTTWESASGEELGGGDPQPSETEQVEVKSKCPNPEAAPVSRGIPGQVERTP